MVEVPITPNNTQVNVSTSVGIAAPQTQAQRADVAATRVVSSKAASESNIQQYSQERTIEAIKYRAKMVAGENSFLNDISFTVYKGGASEVPGAGQEYVIRFTDISTGEIQIKSAPELFHGSGGGDVISGNV